jgi:uncharacterized membrane protein HdeD (DUF308 family)
MFNFGLLILIFLFVVYRGIIPILGFNIWSKYEGWVKISTIDSLFSIAIGLILFYWWYNNIQK